MILYQEMLNDYFFGGDIPVGYWQKFKLRMWIICGSKAYKGHREEVLARCKARSAKRKKLLFKESLERPNPILEMICKEEEWIGAYLPVPFKYGA